MSGITRRSILKGAVVCSATAMLAASTKSPRADFPTDPRARIAVATYPFRALMLAPGNRDRDPSKPGMDLAAFARYIRTEFKVQGIEPLHSHFSTTEQSEIVKLRSAFDAAGVHTVNIPVDEPVELCSEDQARRSAGNASYRRWVDIAVLLGSPSIRVSIPTCADKSDIPRAMQALQPTLDYAARRNIVINLENDDPVLASDARILSAIRQANTPWLRALPDFANSLMGGDERFNSRAVSQMFSHAWNMAHVKDAEVIEGKRKTVSLPELFTIAKASNYQGYYSMESDSEVDPFTDTRHLIEQTIALM